MKALIKNHPEHKYWVELQDRVPGSQEFETFRSYWTDESVEEIEAYLKGMYPKAGDIEISVIDGQK